MTGDEEMDVVGSSTLEREVHASETVEDTGLEDAREEDPLDGDGDWLRCVLLLPCTFFMSSGNGRDCHENTDSRDGQTLTLFTFVNVSVYQSSLLLQCL